MDKRQEGRKRVGALVAQARNAKGITQAQLAEMTGYTLHNIMAIENGRYNVSLDILNRVCDALGVAIELRDL